MRTYTLMYAVYLLLHMSIRNSTRTKDAPSVIDHENDYLLNSTTSHYVSSVMNKWVNQERRKTEMTTTET